MSKKTDKPTPKLPKVHPELEGLDIEINSFGEIKTKFDMDKINRFLDEKVRDKKFKGIEVKRVEEGQEKAQDSDKENEQEEE